jgi:hypothetical protein
MKNYLYILIFLIFSIRGVSQPVIISTLEDLCFNTSYEMRVEPAGGTGYEWQYMIYEKVWQDNFSAFHSFNSRVMDYLQQHAEYYEIDYLAKLETAIFNTDYSTLKKYYNLYYHQYENGNTIGQLLLECILDQYFQSFSMEEYYFLLDHYVAGVEEALNVPEVAAPFVLIYVPGAWNNLSSSGSSDGLINFSPEGRVAPIFEQTKIGLRVRQTSPEISSFSQVRDFYVKPKPPVFSVSADKSCASTATAKITISNVFSLDPNNLYNYNVKKLNGAGQVGSFQGTDFEIETGFMGGDYQVSLYYENIEYNGCSYDQSIHIATYAKPDADIGKKDATCPGSKDGEITVTITDHKGICSITLLDWPTVNNNTTVNGYAATFSNLPAGSYTINLTDECETVPKYKDIVQPAEVTIQASQIDPACLSAPDGSISVTASGGKNIYDYELYNDIETVRFGSVTDITGAWTFPSLPGGSYIVRARSEGCEWKKTGQSLVPVAPVTFTTIAKDVDCFGQSTGMITVNAAGGKTPYSYSLDNQSYVSGNQFTGLHAATYIVKVHTANESCNDVATMNVPVSQAPELIVGLNPVNARCFDNADGSISSAVSGGTGAYSFSWDYKNGTDWFPAGGNTDHLSGLIAGTYRLNVTDIKGCRAAKETIVGQPSALKVNSAVPTDVVCYGSNGSISVIASGGTGGYSNICTSTTGSMFENTSQIVSVPAGAYFVKVKDSNGCEEEFNSGARVTVTGPASPLDFSATVSDYNGFNLSCRNDATGRITLLASGGNGTGYNGYVYSLNGSAYQGGNTYDRLAAGSYTAKVEDARGCSVQKTIVLTEPELLTLGLASVSPVKCFGTPTGEISVIAVGGIPNTYKYRLNGNALPSSGIYKNLNAGTYFVEVSDINGCRQNIEVAVQSLFPQIKSVLSGTDIKCFGEQNGRITAAVTGGTGTYDFQWERKISNLWQTIPGTSNNIENLLPGSYRIRITDSEHCSALDSTMLNEPPKLLITGLLKKDAVCFGESGTLQIGASGGVPGYTFLVSGDAGFTAGSQEPQFDLLPGRYSVRVKDNNGCETAAGEDLLIDGPSVQLDFTSALSSYNGYSVSCKGGNNGKITINASGGNGGSYTGYKYSFGGAQAGFENSFEGLAAGNYIAKVTDGRGCTVQKAIILNEPEQLGLTLFRSLPVKCQGTAGGEISVIATGGIAGSYRYRLNGNDPVTSGTFENLYTGNYNIEVTDANGCAQDLTSSVIYKNQPIKTLLTPEDVSCYGNNNGKIRYEVTGGAGGFSFQWEKKSGTGWQAIGRSGLMQDLSPGYYRLKATDSDNCAVNDSAEVKQPDLLVITELSTRNAICYADSGSINVTASGGNSGYTFSYCPDGGSVFHDFLPGQLMRPDSYRIKITDSKGCELAPELPVIITKPALALNFEYSLKNFSGYNVSCHGKQDGELTVIPSGGNGNGYSGYTYHLAGKVVQNENLFSQLGAGTYNITVKDGRGCTISHQATLTEPNSMISFRALSMKNPVCLTDSNGEVTLSASGGSEPYSWAMDSGEFNFIPRFSNLHVGRYNFKVRDANGCGDEFDTTLVNTVSAMSIAGLVTDAKCFGESTGSISLKVSGGAKPYLYRWKDNPSTAAVALNLQTGDYIAYVTDSAGCKSEKAFHVSQPQVPLSVTATALPACVSLNDGEIRAVSSGGTPPYRFAVDRQSGFLEATSYKVFQGKHTVYAADKNDCSATTAVTVGTKNILPDQNFMLATSRYEKDTLVLIDVSVPVPDKVIWQFPDEAVVIDTSSSRARVCFNTTGIWPVTMTGYFGECVYTIEKLLNIAPFDPLLKEKDNLHKGIKTVKISPNPGDGRFILNIELYTKQQVSIRIMDLYSRIIFNDKYPADIEFNREIILPAEILPGTYIIWVAAENDARSEVLVVTK